MCTNAIVMMCGVGFSVESGIARPIARKGRTAPHRHRKCAIRPGRGVGIEFLFGSWQGSEVGTYDSQLKLPDCVLEL